MAVAVSRASGAFARRSPALRTAAALCAAWPTAAVHPQAQCRKGFSTGGSPKLHVGVVGYGLVGKELVQQILDNAKSLEAELGVGLEVTAVARSKTMAFLSSSSQASLQGGA